MIMENKYFVPEISDIRLGYEYETNYNCEKKWEKKIVNDLYCDNEGNGELQDLLTLINYHNTDILDWKINYSNRIRVPYLTKKDIESEGWLVNENTDTYFTKNDKDCTEKTLFLHVTYEHCGVPVWVTIGYEDNDKDDRFSGACPSINELRYIQKLLGI